MLGSPDRQSLRPGIGRDLDRARALHAAGGTAHAPRSAVPCDFRERPQVLGRALPREPDEKRRLAALARATRSAVGAGLGLCAIPLTSVPEKCKPQSAA